jgi:glycosyltransferase involved in cell wall biosynthesis
VKKINNLFIHDYFQNYGGGERLILNLVKKEDTLLTSFIKKNLRKILKNKKKIILQSNDKLSFKIKKILTPISFYLYKTKNIYRNFLVSGNYSVFIDLPSESNKIFYCHSLPKIFFEFEKFYNKNNLILRVLIFCTKNLFKFFYIKKINIFDRVVVNSNYTKLKLEKYYKKKIHIIYPPVQNYRTNKKNTSNKEVFFLSNSRHEIEKNIDIIIKVFNKINNLNLIILSNGSQTKKLKKLARNNNRIKFLGLVEEKIYKKLLNQAIATINISRNEDFGMAAIEGMSAGKPAIVINEGGYKETCKNNFNSLVIDKNNIEKNLHDALKKINLSKLKKMENNCYATSGKFNSKIFVKKIKKLYI